MVAEIINNKVNSKGQLLRGGSIAKGGCARAYPLQALRSGLKLIPLENFTSLSVMQAVGSVMTNKYSEGYPCARYYGGNKSVPWKPLVSVQTLSGSPTHFQVSLALLKAHDIIIALDLPHGGHLSHGYQTDTKKISAVSIFSETMPYRLVESTRLIEYNHVHLIFS
ncbi:serine hydroxymethyltransferase 1, mitochondrial [Tanacetum coccineum]